MRLAKWYLDVVTDDGRAVILYWTELVLAAVRFRYAASLPSTVFGAALMSVPSAAFTPRTPTLDAPLLGASLAAGLIYAFAIGMDFPTSNRRFSRLT